MAEKKNNSRTGCILLAVGLMVCIGLGVVLLGWLAIRGMGQTTVNVERGSVLDVSLSGSFTEGPSEVDLGLLFGASGQSLWDLRRGLRLAAEDPDIAGLRLRIGGGLLGWAGAEEVLSMLDQFRASGKLVWADLGADMIGDGDYFLATGADRIFVTPEAASVVNGVAVEAQFYRGTFDKVHVEPQVIMYKEYKSAGESFANYEMSDYMRESMTAVLSSIHDRFVERVVDRREIDEVALVEFLSLGMAPGSALLEAGLIDDLAYSDEIEAAFSEVLGSEYRSVSMRRYLEANRPRRGSGKRIAVVFGEGPVVTSAPDGLFPFVSTRVLAGSRVAAHIRKAAEDPRVAAIVFRVNSPGGAVVGSDLVRRAVEQARENGKAVVVSMADVAGSGGYWVAMSADSIVAHSTTMTGSIGVVFTKLNVDPFFEWVGTHTDRLTTSPAADMFGSGPMDESEIDGVRAWMDAAYDSFVEKAASSRGIERSRMYELAKGRVWSGRDAHERNLIDELGGFDVAIELARNLAELDEGAPLVVVPRQRTFFEQLMEQSGSSVGIAKVLTGDVSLVLPGEDEIRAWLRWVGRPQVQARMPDILLR